MLRSGGALAWCAVVGLAAAMLSGCAPRDGLDVVKLRSSWEDRAPAALLTGELVVDGECVYAVDEDGTAWSLVFYSRMDPTVTAERFSFESAPGQRVEIALDGGAAGPLGFGGGMLARGLEERLEGGHDLACYDLDRAWLVAEIVR